MYVGSRRVKEGGWGEVADGAAVETGGPTAEISGSLQAAFNLNDGR